MKRIILIPMFVSIVLLVLSYFYYSSENVKPVESDLAKYPEMSPFIVGLVGFRGIRFNLDSNYYSFAFPTSFDKADTYFGAVDLAAKRDGWRLVGSDVRSRVYIRKKDAPVGMFQSEKITLFYDSEKQEVTLVREDAVAPHEP